MADQKAVMWSVSGEHFPDSFVLGTMHVRDYRAFHSFEKAKQLIHACVHYYAEMDLEEAALQQDSSDFLIPGGADISDLIGRKKYKKIRSSLLRSFRIDLDNYRLFLPFLISNIIAESLLQQDHQEPLDHILWEFAAREGLKMGGLESFNEQQSVMRKIPMDYQIRSLKDLARNPSKFRKNLLSLVDNYIQEDIRMLYKQSRKSMGALRKLMLWDRNKNMADRIFQTLEKGPNFYAIGAAHLAGQKGVLNLLKQQGARISPMH